MTQIPITSDGGGNLYAALKGRIDITDFSAATVTALSNELIADTRMGVVYVEVDHLLEADEGNAATILPFSGVVPAGSIVTKCIVSCREAFDGAETVTIGRTAAVASILASANITKTLGAVSGEDPTLYGTDLWVAGTGTPAQTATAAALTGANSSLSTTGTNSTWAFDVNGAMTTGANSSLALTGSNSTLSLSSGGNWAVTAWPTLATLGHPKVKWCAADTQYNAYIAAVEGSAEAGTTGILDCYLFYQRAVMSA